MRYGFDGCLFELVLSFGWNGTLSDIDHRLVSKIILKVKNEVLFHTVVVKRVDFELFRFVQIMIYTLWLQMYEHKRS